MQELDLATALADDRTEYDKMVAGDWYRYRSGPELAELTTSTHPAHLPTDHRPLRRGPARGRDAVP